MAAPIYWVCFDNEKDGMAMYNLGAASNSFYCCINVSWFKITPIIGDVEGPIGKEEQALNHPVFMSLKKNIWSKLCTCSITNEFCNVEQWTI